MRSRVYSLNWKLFTNHLDWSLNDAFEGSRFSDVTLVSDDKIPFQAHKFLLSACSPVLYDLISNNLHEHPLIYFRGVNHQELKSVLQLLYLGQVEIEGKLKKRLLKILEELTILEKLKLSIILVNASNQSSHSATKLRKSPENLKYLKDKKQSIGTLEKDQCLYFCIKCDLTYKSKRSLNEHEASEHRLIRYPCNLCKYKAKYKRDLKRHQDFKHGDVAFYCNQCDYYASCKRNLKRHKNSIHGDKIAMLNGMWGTSCRLEEEICE